MNYVGNLKLFYNIFKHYSEVGAHYLFCRYGITDYFNVDVDLDLESHKFLRHEICLVKGFVGRKPFNTTIAGIPVLL